MYLDQKILLQEIVMPERSEQEKIINGFFLNYNNPGTRKEYFYALKEMFKLLGAEITHPRQLKKHHIIAYKAYLQEQGLSPKTIMKKLAAVSSFCRHLGEEGLVDKDITYGISRPSEENTRETAALTDIEVGKMFSALDPKRYHFHCYQAILSIGFYAGFRVSEIKNLKIKNLGLHKGLPVFYINVKGGKNHEIAMHPKIVSALNSHLLVLAEKGFDTGNPEQVVFPSLKTKANRPMTTEAFAYIFKSTLDRADINKNTHQRYNTHTMRCSFASHLLNDQKIPLQDVQSLMGHKDPSTTQRYNKRGIEHEHSPVFRISY